jgi:hypothetical protein
MTDGHGADAVRSFYETWFIGHWPEDIKITRRRLPVGISLLLSGCSLNVLAGRVQLG